MPGYKKTILLIEDNKPIRENTAELLELEDYEILSAVNGKEALAVLSTSKPDLILCDIAMPQMDGYEFLKFARNEYDLHATPFIFFTAYSEKADIQKGLELGATAYLVKPFEPDDLVRLIREHLEPQTVQTPLR